MSSIQDFYQLPENIQKEVLDFMSYVAEKNGVNFRENKSGKTGHKWLKKVNRPKDTVEPSAGNTERVQRWSTDVPVFENSGELVTKTVRKLRDEEKW